MDAKEFCTRLRSATLARVIADVEFAIDYCLDIGRRKEMEELLSAARSALDAREAEATEAD